MQDMHESEVLHKLHAARIPWNRYSRYQGVRGTSKPTGRDITSTNQCAAAQHVSCICTSYGVWTSIASSHPACRRLRDICRAPALIGTSSMPRFKLIPIDCPQDYFEFDASNAASVLDMAVQKNFRETDVHRDGRYAFTISHGENGLWTISQRPVAERLFRKPPDQAFETNVRDFQQPMRSARHLEMAHG